ncbi:MAG: DinB family protein [Planctomycetes bacterium]|nr:DinB family protein [Planctomycetota bacterium]MCW8135782.1 DinB family protein [Planctomycetota bacterium]
MFTSAALLDIHTRTHASLGKLIGHCAGFSADELSRTFDGFGGGPIRMQLHHAIGAEQYWVGVIRGLMLVEERPEDFASIEALHAYRRQVAQDTTDYLRGASESELNTSRKMTTFGGRQHELMPARIIVRTQTHIFQHQGQVAAMARLLGRPIPHGLDFPLG